MSRDWKTFSSSLGVDIDDTGGEFGHGNFLEEDPPLHDVLRAVYAATSYRRTSGPPSSRSSGKRSSASWRT